MKLITSPANPTYRQLLRLLQARGIRKYQQALVSGEKIVRELLASGSPEVLALVSSSRHENIEGLNAVSRLVLEPELFRQLDVCGTDFPLVLVRCAQPVEWAGSLPVGTCVALAFQDPENVGSVLRSSVAFGVRDILLLEQCASPFLPKAIRASAGAVFHCRFFAGPRLEDIFHLPYPGQIVSLSAEGKPLAETVFSDPTMLVPGIEGAGIPARWREQSVSIPMDAGVESLNAAVATSIVLYHMAQRRR
ncbi:RNA methyltransferase [Desulfurispirillum indicum]|uniref:tRNA/rRNA methyltransferase (SpoU) n=1 Tax=Desulfurispirillum indicum (strain ATCC BAA-1389 / DSM 22839 / S5) TaxID=653733 RepID=E6W470_DESIS|nr:RNA methyltransferase [Desulfurispirillum indicum]ADU67034.1 tRNA/rRNA methyltransferase (SpoU) [Desulfurispirillum indicum S5]UCZ56266.1 RNA methyltransferase [Desulfurispirillum indicum]